MQLLEKSETLATANDEDFSIQTLLDLVDAALEYESVNEVHVPSWGLDSDEIWKNGIVLAKNDPQRIVVAVRARSKASKRPTRSSPTARGCKYPACLRRIRR